MTYNHGIRIQENPTSIGTPLSNESGVPVVFGTAPVNMAADPANATNKLFLCNSFAEAKAALGYSEDYEKYSLCQAMDAFFKLFGVGPVVLCNVLDPNKHKVEYTETFTVSGGQIRTKDAGIVLSTLKLTASDEELAADTDYTAEFEGDGTLLITIIKSGVTEVVASGSKLDPSMVTESDIIGSYDAETGKETGIELVRQVYPLFNVVPNLLLAPGWSHKPSVGLALAAKCYLNNVFLCECLVDIDTTVAKKYTDVTKVKEEAGFMSKHMVCLYPMVKAMGKVFYFSAVYAALAIYTDTNNDSVPNLSPSNKALGISATVLADGTEIALDLPQANTLNAVGVVTAINVGGFKAWGNNTAAYPVNTDPKDRWIPCRRFFSWWGNSFITTYLIKVDDPANYRLIESVVDSENIRGNALVSQGKCAGIRMEYRQDDNPIQNIMNGKMIFRQFLAPYTPAEDIVNILEFDAMMIRAALGGE